MSICAFDTELEMNVGFGGRAPTSAAKYAAPAGGRRGQITGRPNTSASAHLHISASCRGFAAVTTCGATHTLSSPVAKFELRRRPVAKPGGGPSLWRTRDPAGGCGNQGRFDHPCRRSGALKNETSKSIVRPNLVSAPRILVVEDEIDVALLISYNLEAEGYFVESVARGDEAELRLAENAPDLLILDWMLPAVSGIEICRRLRARETTRTLPVIMVTARNEESERVRGLAVGADDYVVKPFSVIELMARVRALLRRSRPERVAERLYVGDLDLDRLTRRVRRGDRDIHLGPTDFRLLEYLLEKPGRVFSRAQLLDLVWGRSAEIDERTVDVHIGRLRKKLSKGRERDPIRTVRAAGYSIDEGFGHSDRR
jgi:two-component system, OmpR family, phosphate regulon response regulator PhoB